MLHKFLEEGDWFLPKRYGYGSGLPIAWQGWVVLIAYIVALVGIGMIAQNARGAALAGVILIGLILTLALIEITRRRTRGGWRWRWGEPD
jgi:hypothetical protein